MERKKLKATTRIFSFPNSHDQTNSSNKKSQTRILGPESTNRSSNIISKRSNIFFDLVWIYPIFYSFWLVFLLTLMFLLLLYSLYVVSIICSLWNMLYSVNSKWCLCRREQKQINRRNFKKNIYIFQYIPLLMVSILLSYQ